MYVGIFPDKKSLAEAAAHHLTQVITESTHKVIGVATGSSPLPLYEELRRMHRDGEFTLRGVRAFALDEYIGIDDDHPERYRNVLRTELVGEDKTGLREEDLMTPDGSAPNAVEAARIYDQHIRDAGGITIQLLGIGSDGHIGFNEPAGSLASRTHVEILTQKTREDNARFFEDDIDKVPTRCITQGLGTIMEAHETMLIATGEKKADAIRELVEGAVSAKWPATILQMHPNTRIYIDEVAASKLELADFYRARWEQRHEA